MIPTITRERSVEVADVEAELAALAAPNRGLAANIGTIAVTLALFVMLGAMQGGVQSMVLLVVVIVIHELGHLVAMKTFGYRDVQMFFIPLFGAAVSGVETSPSGTRRALVSLAGPVPGLVLGVVSAVLFHASGQPIYRDLARTFLLLNTFNLLPLNPLDGGRFLEAVVFSRSPGLRVGFQAVTGIALLALAIGTGGVLFIVFSVLMLATVHPAYVSGKLAAALKREMRAEAATAGTLARVPTDYVARLIPLVEPRLPDAQRTPKGVAAMIHGVWNLVWFTPPTLAVSLVLLVVYGSCVIGGVVATFGAEMSFAAPAPGP